MKTIVISSDETERIPMYRFAGISMKRWLYAIVLVLLFIALCVVVFGGEQEVTGCDLQSGLPVPLNLSLEQCKNMRRLVDKFRNDTSPIRAKIIEKRLELRRLSEDPKTNPYAINKVERELNALEQEFSRRAYKTEAGQRRLLTPEQINKMKDMPYGYRLQGYGRKGYRRR